MSKSYILNEVYGAARLNSCQFKSKNNRAEIIKQPQFINHKSKITTHCGAPVGQMPHRHATQVFLINH